MNHKDFLRIKKLTDLDLDYLELREDFSKLNSLAASVAGTELSEINFIDNITQWTVASTLGGFTQRPREKSICHFTIEEEHHLKIRLDKDKRFQNSTYILDEGYKFYYGIPLKLPDDIAIGTLCVGGKKVEDLNALQIEQLHLIADQIVKHIQLKFELKQAKDSILYEGNLKRQLAHDVRSPLSGISQLVKLTNFEDSSRSELVNIIQLIASSAESVLDLTDEILSKGHSVKEPQQNKGLLTSKSLGTKLLNIYKPQAEARKIQFSVHAKDAERTLPRKNLLPIIGNLISNAIKFTEPDGKVSVYLSLKSNLLTKEMLEIRVEDTGVGMTGKQLKAIVETDSQDRLESSGTNGFGMGLLFVRELTENLGGSLEIKSKRGLGTQVSVLLPMD